LISRLKAVDPDDAPTEVKRLLETTRQTYGIIPNMARVMALAPVVLEGFNQLVTALSSGKLDAQLREQIALVVSEANRSQYCLSVHTSQGADAGLDEAELTSSRLVISSDPKAEVALRFARALVDDRGELTDEDFAALRRVGLADDEIVEIIGNVLATTFTNYFNKAVQVEIDFPITGMAIAPPPRRPGLPRSSRE
jgi:uncharacterized peroxidase-related enzyme